MLTGREREVKRLFEALHSDTAQFLAVYGRRRVGKTFLIREILGSHPGYVEVTGIKNGDAATQLNNFLTACEQAFHLPAPLSRDIHWAEALALFTHYVSKSRKKIILFLDEFPWLATDRSGLLEQIDHFWNAQWSRLDNLLLIVCGSAAAWILEKIVANTGGLHNRVTGTIHLQPFSLKDVALYLLKRGFKYNHQQLVELYLYFGGIPYYLNFLNKRLSPAENVNKLLFDQLGDLHNEYDFLLQSLFRDSSNHEKIVAALAKKRYGLALLDVSRLSKITVGSSLTNYIQELKACSFITEYVPFGKKERGAYYRLTDEFVLFYKHFLEPLKKRGTPIPKEYWHKMLSAAQYFSVMGYNYESLCQKHLDSLLTRLGISGMAVQSGTWKFVGSASTQGQTAGVQIDLLLDRPDQIITLCEMKYSREPVSISKAEVKKYLGRLATFKAMTKTRKAVSQILISHSGAVANANLDLAFTKVLTSEDLFY